MKKVLLLILLVHSILEVAGQATPDSSRVVTVNEIFIIGNNKTKASVILRELSVNKGEAYNLSELSAITVKDQEKIYNTNLFNEVEVQILESGTTQVELLVRVDERWYFYPAPIFDLIDRNMTDWIKNHGASFSRLNWGVKLDQYNFRGRNEKLRFIGQLGPQRKLVLSYSMPYIDKAQKSGLAFNVSYIERLKMPYTTIDHVWAETSKSEINRRSLNSSVTYSYRPSFYDFHFAKLNFRKSTVTDSVVLLNPNYFGNAMKEQNNFIASYTYIKDHRNRRTYPTDGYYFEVFAEKTGLGIFKDINMFSIEGTINKYSDLGKGFYLANSLVGMISTPNEQPYFNYMELGYNGRFIRGFEEDLIEGPKYFLSRNSARKQFMKHRSDISNIIPVKQFSKFKLDMYAKLFADFGYVENYPNYPNGERLTDKWLGSAGLGVDVVLMYDLVLRFEYSHTTEQDINDFFNFKEHFRLNIKADM
ncbi:MAG: BamA/TamA family outer membrane protein [Cyclobacteriaceae bacterium]